MVKNLVLYFRSAVFNSRSGLPIYVEVVNDFSVSPEYIKAGGHDNSFSISPDSHENHTLFDFSYYITT
jgi:hypothetical protein